MTEESGSGDSGTDNYAVDTYEGDSGTTLNTENTSGEEEQEENQEENQSP